MHPMSALRISSNIPLLPASVPQASVTQISVQEGLLLVQGLSVYYGRFGDL